MANTLYAKGADKFLTANIDLVNDTWQGADPELLGVAAVTGAGYVVSHTGGLPPRTDPVNVDYGPDDAVVDDVLRVLRDGAARARLRLVGQVRRLDPVDEDVPLERHARAASARRAAHPAGDGEAGRRGFRPSGTRYVGTGNADFVERNPAAIRWPSPP